MHIPWQPQVLVFDFAQRQAGHPRIQFQTLHYHSSVPLKRSKRENREEGRCALDVGRV